MVVFVKINKTYVPGAPVIESAYHSWELGKLLDQPELRNACKYLIAIYNKQIIEAFCIKAIAEDKKSSGRKRRIRFALEEVELECKQKLVKACTNSLSYINSIQASSGYISVEPSSACSCVEEIIPVVGEDNITHGRIRKPGPMELKFIWVNDYRAIKKLGFNFNHSGKHKFRYDDETIILIAKEVNKISFGKKINGVTAIAGENGSGKSSLCEISLLTTATRVNGSVGWDIKFDGIVCYGNYIFYHQSTKIKNVDQLEREGYILKKFKETPFEEIDFEERKSFNDGGFIYYSNVLDLRSDFGAMNLANISSQNLLREDYKFSTSYPSSNPYTFEPSDEFKYMDQDDPIQIYNLGQGYRSTKFYLNYPTFLPFRQPEHIILKSTYTGNNRWLRLSYIEDFKVRSEYERVQNEILSIIYPFKNVSSDEHDTELPIDPAILKKGVKQLYRFNLVVAKGLETKTITDPVILRDFVFKGSVDGLEISSIEELVIIHESLIELSSTYKHAYKPFSLFLNYNSLNEWRYMLLERVFVPNTDESRLLLKQFMQLEDNILRRDDRAYRRISNYSLQPQLSSGESSFINLFSRLHDVVERYKQGVDNRTNIILFLDEAEIGFHPQWNKKFFSWLLDFLTNHIEGFTFQIILTTHSPYLLSDIPSQNVLLLRKGLDGKTIIVPSEEYETFGANINELLATSFFLEDGLIGEFAKNKIQNLIDNLQMESPQTLKEKLSPQQMLEMIGLIAEPFLRDKLLEMYYEKMPGDFTNEEERRMRIIELETELNKLRNG